MAEKLKVELQDENGNVYYLYTDASIVFCSDGKTVEEKLVNMKGATASAAGAAGLVPAPAAGDNGKYLRGDGTWGKTSDITVAFSASTSRLNISTGEKLSTIFGKIAKWFSDLKSHAFLDLIQNATTADTTRAVSAAVAKNLQDQITEQNTNLTKSTITDLTESVTSGYTFSAVRSGNILQVIVKIPSGTSGWITAGKIQQKYAPFELTPMAVRAADGNDNAKMQGFYVHANGQVAGYITSALTAEARVSTTYII